MKNYNLHINIHLPKKFGKTNLSMACLITKEITSDLAKPIACLSKLAFQDEKKNVEENSNLSPMHSVSYDLIIFSTA